MRRPSADLRRLLSKASKLFLIPLLAGFLAGCQAMAPTFSETAVLTKIKATTPSATSSQAPPTAKFTPIPSLTPTATPFPPLAELPASQVSYVLPLTVQAVGEQSAQLLFELEHPAEGNLLLRQVRQAGALVQAFPISPKTSYQMITVEPLEPNTDYEAILALRDSKGSYSQPSFLDEPWGSVTFHTQSTTEPLHVGVIGDSGFGEPVTAKLAEQMAAYPLDFVIHTGDLVYQTSENASTAEAFALKYYRPFSPILHHTPVYAVPGNHEYAKDACVDNQPFYFDVFAPLADLDQGDQPVTGKRQYYAIVYQNIQFLFLDSQVFFGEEGKQEQEDWLKERLQDDRFIYSVVIFHIPPFTSSLIHPKDSLPVRQDLQPLFAAARVPLVLSGHSHNYERLNVDGTTYIVSGGGSGELYPAGKHDPHSQVFSMSSHFVLLELYSDHISITAIDKDGKVIDQSTVLISKK